MENKKKKSEESKIIKQLQNQINEMDLKESMRDEANYRLQKINLMYQRNQLLEQQNEILNELVQKISGKEDKEILDEEEEETQEDEEEEEEE